MLLSFILQRFRNAFIHSFIRGTSTEINSFINQFLEIPIHVRNGPPRTSRMKERWPQIRVNICQALCYCLLSWPGILQRPNIHHVALQAGGGGGGCTMQPIASIWYRCHLGRPCASCSNPTHIGTVHIGAVYVMTLTPPPPPPPPPLTWGLFNDIDDSAQINQLCAPLEVGHEVDTAAKA